MNLEDLISFMKIGEKTYEKTFKENEKNHVSYFPEFWPQDLVRTQILELKGVVIASLPPPGSLDLGASYGRKFRNEMKFNSLSLLPGPGGHLGGGSLKTKYVNIPFIELM